MIQRICEDKLLALKKRYSNIHPLMFHRSLERARSMSDLFEILESVPDKLPIVWDESKRMWVREADLTALARLKELKKKRLFI